MAVTTEQNYGMFSAHGNALVAQLVNDLPAGDEEITLAYLKAGFQWIKAFGHAEVYDTAVRERVADAVYRKYNCRVSAHDIQ